MNKNIVQKGYQFSGILFSLSLHANLGSNPRFFFEEIKNTLTGLFYIPSGSERMRGCRFAPCEPGLESSFLLRRNKKYPFGSFLLPGGSERIRTSDTLLYTRVPGVLLQPLGHASVWIDYNRYRSFFSNMNYRF